MKTYILKPIMTPLTVVRTVTLDKPVVARTLPPRQPLPVAVIDPNKPMLKLGLDVHLDFTMAVAQKDHANPHSPRKFSRAQLVERVKQWIAEGLQVFCVQESCGFGFTLHRELVAAGAQSFLITPKAALREKIAALQDKRDWHDELLAQLDDEQKQISVTDPDTRRMHTANGNVVGYNAQLAVDAKNKLIAADDVTNEVNDFKQLANVAMEAKENLELKQTEVVADKGYYNAAEVSRCIEQNITPHVPKADTSANTKAGLFGKSRFRFDAEKNIYLCPGNQELTYRFSTHELGRDIHYYRASGCKDCALRKQCTRNKNNRTITREDNEHLMEAMAQRMKREPEKFKLTKQLAEHPFGTIKRWMGYTHFTLKGLEKVRTEWSLITLAYNLKRVLNLVSVQKLIAAVS